VRPLAPRFSARREIALGLGFYALYLLVRELALRSDGRGRARRNAERVVDLERRLGIHVEPDLQRRVLPRRRLLAGLNLAYATLNVGLTVGWLIRLFRRRHPEYHRLRRAVLLGGLGAQPFFLLFPVSPPRTLDHLTDTILEVSGVDLDSGSIARLYHPLAAFPSIHVTVAVITAAGIRETSERPLVQALAPAYPPLVAAVVLLTANHYVVDAVGGAVLGRVAVRLARGPGRRR
jgi:hypothetical protein